MWEGNSIERDHQQCSLSEPWQILSNFRQRSSSRERAGIQKEKEGFQQVIFGANSVPKSPVWGAVKKEIYSTQTAQMGYSRV